MSTRFHPEYETPPEGADRLYAMSTQHGWEYYRELDDARWYLGHGLTKPDDS